ncbi:MAG: SPOR domain-containing protein [Balneolaceae bacterium]
MNRIALLFFFLFLISCSSSEPTVEQPDDDEERTESLIDIPDEVVDDYLSENLNEEELLLVQTRSYIENQFTNQEQPIPDIFLREVVTEEREIDPYAGFRVQLLSTRDVTEADTVRNSFVAWADTMITGYEVDAYVLFRPPNYRVRAGDFRDRDQAIKLSNMLKAKYPDAWVVHDRIEPENVPADTVEFGFTDFSLPTLDVESE